MAIDVQVAIQGGGAKIFGLLAVMQALQETKDIRVTRIAGTSAGSIIAVLLAAGCQAKDLRERVASPSAQKKLLTMFPPVRWYDLALMAVRHRPLRSETHLRSLLTDTLSRAGLVNPTFKDLRDKHNIAVKVVATDVTYGEPRIFEADGDRVVDALLHSCGLPFYFRVGGRQETLVDGGLLENFPITILSDPEKKYGPILGIGFADRARTPPESLFAFALSLFDASISYSMRRAREGIAKEAIIDIVTSVGTLDFKGALTDGMKSQYDVIRLNARQSLQSFLDHSRRGGGKVIPVALELVQLKRQLGEIYRTVTSEVKYRHQTLTWEIQANTLASEDEADERAWRERPDIVRYKKSFAPTGGPIRAIKVEVAPTPATKSVARSTIGWEDIRRWTLVDAANRVLEVIDVVMSPGSPSEASSVQLWFKRALEVGAGKEPYSLVFTDAGVGTTDVLLHEGRDSFGLEWPRADGPVGRAEIVLHLPKSVGRVNMTVTKGDSVFQGEQMSEAEVAKNHNSPPGFRTYVWFGENIPADKSLSVDVQIERWRGTGTEG